MVANILLLSHLRPIDDTWIIKHIKQCGRILVIEEGNKIGGWGAEVASSINEKAFEFLNGPILRLGSPDVPIPASGSMENEMLPSAEKIKDLIKFSFKI